MQIHRLPLSRVTPATAEKLGGLVGRVMEIDRGSGKGLNSLFLRVRVEVSLNAPIVVGMEVKRGGEKKTPIFFRYEKLPNV